MFSTEEAATSYPALSCTPHCEQYREATLATFALQCGQVSTDGTCACSGGSVIDSTDARSAVLAVVAVVTSGACSATLWRTRGVPVEGAEGVCGG